MKTPLLAALIGALSCLPFSAVFADPGTAPPTDVPAVPMTTHSVVLSYVRPGLMAWWLDPKHQPVPAEFKGIYQNADDFGPNRDSAKSWHPPGAPTDGAAGPDNRDSPADSQAAPPSPQSDLPSGIKSVVPMDAQNCLLVSGTDDGYRELLMIVKILDKPMAKVQIDAELAEVDSSFFKSHGLNFSSSAGPFQLNHISGSATSTPEFAIALARDNCLQDLALKVEDGSAKIIFADSAVVSSNTEAAMGTWITDKNVVTPLRPGDSDLAIDRYPQFAPVGTTYKLFVIPTANPDNTVTTLVHFIYSKRDAESTAASPPKVTSSSITSVVNIKMGDTIVLGGLSLPASYPGNQIVLLITAKHITLSDPLKGSKDSVAGSP